MKLVIYPPLDANRLHAVEDVCGDMLVINASDDEHALCEIVDADAFYGKITPQLLQTAQQLKWIQSPTASLEHYLFPELIQHPAVLTNMRGLFYDVIADHVLMFILMFCRGMHVYSRQQQRGEWNPLGGEQSRSNFDTGPGLISDMDRAHRQLAGLTVGILGVGSIGSEIASHCHKMKMDVLAVDPYRTPEQPYISYLGGMDRTEELLNQSDFVVIAAPHTPETEGFFNFDRFRQMRDTAYLINIGRGAIVPLDDLRNALDNHEIAGAALDVAENEPLPQEDPLWRHPQVLITPHVAACSVEIPKRHLETLVENVRRFAHGEALLNITNKERWF